MYNKIYGAVITTYITAIAVVYIESGQTWQAVFHLVTWNKSVSNIRWLYLCWRSEKAFGLHEGVKHFIQRLNHQRSSKHSEGIAVAVVSLVELLT